MAADSWLDQLVELVIPVTLSGVQIPADPCL